MITAQTDQWYLRTADEAIFGPVALDELQEWAADGRVAPEHSVSADGKAWKPASALPELEMTWTIAFDTGTSYGPLNLRALRDYIHDGSVGLDAAMRHVVSGEQATVREKLADIFATPPPAPVDDGSKARAAELEQQLAVAQQAAKAAQADLTKARSQAQHREAEARSRLDALSADVGEAREQLQRVEQERERERELREESRQREGEAKDASVELDSRLRDLSAQLAAAETAVRQHEADLEATRETLQREQQRSAEAEATCTATIGTLTAALEERERELADAGQQHATAAAEAARLKALLEATTQQAEDAQAAHARQTADAQTREDDLQQSLAASQTKTAEVQAALDATSGQLDQLKGDLLRLREEYSARDAEHELLLRRTRDQAEDAAQQIAALKAASATHEAELATAQERLTDTESRLETSDSALAAARVSIATLTGETEALETRLADETAARQAQAAEAARAAEDAGNARRAAEAADEGLARLREALESEQTRAREREKELDESLAEQVKLHDQDMGAWEHREENLQRKITQLQRNCEEALAEGNELRQQLEDAKRKPPAAEAAPASPLAGLEAQAQAELKRWMKGR